MDTKSRNKIQSIIERRKSRCFRDCKDLCEQKISPDGGCVIAECAAAKELSPILFPENSFPPTKTKEEHESS